MKHRLLPALLLLAFAPAAFADDIVIKAAKIYTAAGEPLSPGMVRVKDGKIAEVGASLDVPAGVKLIDLGSGVLIPGLIDAHTSIGVEGGAAESTLEVTPNFRVLDGVDWSAKAFRQARAEGVTAVSLVPGTDNVIAGRSCIVKTAGKASQRVMKADHALVVTMASDPATGNNSRNRPDSIYNRQPTNRMGVVWILRNEFGRAKEAGAKANPAMREALDGKRPVTCVSRADCDITAALRLKSEYPMNLTIAGGQEAYKMKAELAAAKVPVLLGQLTTTPGSGPEQTETVLNLALPLHEAGIPIALTGGKLLDQARLAARFGLPKDVALAAITATPAKLLGIEDRLGTIAVGRDADLVALSGDPFDLTSVIRWTMIDGTRFNEEP
jgi:imidazolonepropionase-like amidohydrolase